MIQLDKREPVPFSSNPFGLVYENSITENKENEVQIHLVTYSLNGIKIASNIYTPKSYNKAKKYPAIVIAVPNGAVKEQAAGLYGQRLAEKGYITITDDGVGMDEETLKYIFDEKQKKEKKPKSNGVGVPNVQKRLQLYYGPEYGISYISRQGEGTVATVTIPLDGGENHE